MKKLLTILSLALLLTLSLAACGQPQESDESAEATTAPEPDDAPAPTEDTSSAEAEEMPEEEDPVEEVAEEDTAMEGPEQRFAAAFGVGPGGGEPEIGRPWTGGGANNTHHLLYLSPTLLNEDLTDIIPYAVESWEHNEDYTVWTYTLRDDLLWSDGEPLTADDWKFTADFITTPDYESDFLNHRALAFDNVVGYEERLAGEADTLEGVEVIDERTVQYTLTSPSPRHYSTQYRTYFLPEHAIDFAPSEYLTTDWWYDPARQVGSGAFIVSEYEPDSFMILEKNVNYFEGEPKLDEIVIRYFGGDITAAVLALAAGEIDFTYLEPTDISTLPDGYNIYFNNSNVPVYTDIHYTEVPEFWQDVRVRQAILHAIDRVAITEQILEETHFPIPCPVSFPDLWPDDVNWYEYDPDRAQQLLQEAGVDPSEITMEWVGHSGYDNIMNNSALQAVQAFLSDIGVEMTYRFVDVPSFRDRYTADGPWTFHYRGSAQPLFPPEYARAWTDAGVQGGEFKGYSMADAGLQQAVEDIFAAESDEAYREAVRTFCGIHNETLPDLQMWIGNRYGAASDRVANFWWQPAGGGGPYYDQPHLWEIVEP